MQSGSIKIEPNRIIWLDARSDRIDLRIHHLFPIRSLVPFETTGGLATSDVRRRCLQKGLSSNADTYLPAWFLFVQCGVAACLIDDYVENHCYSSICSGWPLRVSLLAVVQCITPFFCFAYFCLAVSHFEALPCIVELAWAIFLASICQFGLYLVYLSCCVLRVFVLLYLHWNSFLRIFWQKFNIPFA